MTSHVERAVAARIEAARARAEREKRRRQELAEARQHGLAARKRTELARLAALDNTSPAASGA